MDERLLKQTAISSFILMILVVVMSFIFSRFNQSLIYTSSSNTQADIPKWNQAGGNNSNTKDSGYLQISKSINDKLGDKYLVIKKSNNLTYDIGMEDLYMDRSVKLTVKGLKIKEFDNTSILRFNKGIEFAGLPQEADISETVASTVNSNSTDNESSIDNKATKDNAAAEDNAVRDNEEEDIAVQENAADSEKASNDNTADSHNIGNTAATSYTVVNNTNSVEEQVGKEEELLVPEVISASGEVSEYGNISQTTISDPVEEFKIDYDKDSKSGTYTAVFTIALDYIYAPIIYQDEEYIYIDLRRPKDVYDKIVVVDAGHGGKDVGTSSANGNYYEKDINLQIVLYLKELLDREDIKVYYTRTTDKTIFLNPRVYFANDVEADLFLSIHCNSNESSVPNGIEVLYNELQKGTGFKSKQLAEIALKDLADTTHRNNRGLVKGSEMVVVGKANMPMALIEVSFMSNQDDMNFLIQEKNQKNIAKAVYNTILDALKQVK